MSEPQLGWRSDPRPVLTVVGRDKQGLHGIPRQGNGREVLEDRRRNAPVGPLHLLMVEDSAADGRLVLEMLREARVSWRLERVERIREAQLYLERHSVDCVLLDLGLLDTDGLDGLRMLVASDPEIPVVVLTRRDDDVLSAEALRHGAQDYLPKRALEPQMLTRAVRYAIERKASELQLVHLAQHDVLTGLANRSLFLERLASAMSRRSGVGTLFLDVDNLKLVNDTLGHEAGDRLLITVARRLQTAVRPSDTVARFGGDEFAVVCPGLADPTLARELAERLMAEVAEPVLLASKIYVPSLSMGVALTLPGVTESSESAVANADLALYEAKRQGKARYELFAETLRNPSRQLLSLQTELRVGLVEDQFEVHYQPEVSLGTGELVAVEALVRWRHPTRGLLCAGQFIEAVEEAGLVSQVGSWVFDRSCADLAAWPGRTPPRFAINISPRQFSMVGFVDGVVRAMEEHGVRPEQIELEVTESALLVDVAAARVLLDLHGLGIRLAIDDFGTGYSSLNHLKMFPASTVKIDQTFVAGLGEDRTDEAIVAAVLGVAHSLGLSTVGEGIETVAQRDWLTELGCELGQGYLLAKAMPADLLYARYC